MKLKIQSEKEFISKGIVEQIKNLKQQKKIEYSANLHSSLSQLVQVYMRKMAQTADSERLGRANLVNQAIQKVRSDLEKELQKFSIKFDFSIYVKNITKVLDFPSKEIDELKNRLSSANKEERIGSKEIFYTRINTSIEIIELGLRGSIDGLLVNPLLESYEIDFKRIKEKYSSLRGDWFPFEIIIDDFTFIIDDDGTIFVSVEKMPERLINDVKIKLQELANEIYVPFDSKF